MGSSDLGKISSHMLKMASGTGEADADTADTQSDGDSRLCSNNALRLFPPSVLSRKMQLRSLKHLFSL